MTKPPSLASASQHQCDTTGPEAALLAVELVDGRNYVSWQHMSTPLVVHNSFHMLPLEEKELPEPEQYSRSRGTVGNVLVRANLPSGLELHAAAGRGDEESPCMVHR